MCASTVVARRQVLVFFGGPSAHNARVTSALKEGLGAAALHNISDGDPYRRQRHSFAMTVNESDGEAAGFLSCKKN